VISDPHEALDRIADNTVVALRASSSPQRSR
jgi:hypothetical protein